MSVTPKQSIRQIATFVSTGLASDETRFASEMNFRLRGLISQNREKAAGGQKGLNKNLSATESGIKRGLKIADDITGVVTIMSPQGALKKFTALAKDVDDIRVDNQITQKSNLYKDYFPTDEMLGLFSSLVMLTVAKRGFVESKEKPGISLGKITDRLLGKKESEMDKMVDLEVKKIWDYFDQFVRNKEKYDDFRGKAWAGKVRDLFSVCELGNPKDPIGIHNNYAVNELWLNLFAYYLQWESKDVKLSVMLDLQSIVKVVANMQIISDKVEEITEKKLVTIEERQAIQEKRQDISEEIQKILLEMQRVNIAGQAILPEEQKGFDERLSGLYKRQTELKEKLEQLKGKNEIAEEGLKDLNHLNGQLKDSLEKPVESAAQIQPMLYLKYPAPKVKQASHSLQFFAQNQKDTLSMAKLACLAGNEDAYSMLNV